jgi:hypothetical protein
MSEACKIQRCAYQRFERQFQKKASFGRSRHIGKVSIKMDYIKIGA